jgi:hypothetical protein
MRLAEFPQALDGRPVALVLDPAQQVPDEVDAALERAGYAPQREAELRWGLVRLFKEPVPLVIIVNTRPLLDASSVIAALRRAADCASRRSQIFAVNRRPGRRQHRLVARRRDEPARRGAAHRGPARRHAGGDA